MKILTTILFTIGSLSVYAQVDSNENMVLQLVKKAVDSERLPKEVVNMKDSTKYPHNVVVIHRTKVNELKSGVYLKRDDVDYRIWTGEELFTYDVYWIVPSAIQVERDKISFNFVTKYGGTKKRPCYTGTIKGRQEKGEWILLSASYKKTKCKFDPKFMYE
jgi:hypothetical protein